MTPFTLRPDTVYHTELQCTLSGRPRPPRRRRQAVSAAERDVDALELLPRQAAARLRHGEEGDPAPRPAHLLHGRRGTQPINTCFNTLLNNLLTYQLIFSTDDEVRRPRCYQLVGEFMRVGATCCTLLHCCTLRTEHVQHVSTAETWHPPTPPDTVTSTLHTGGVHFSRFSPILCQY